MSDNMKNQINRLGYGAWAENIIVNFLEDWREEFTTSNKFSMTIEKEDYHVNAHTECGTLFISVRAYVDGDGWQSLEQAVKID